MANRDGAIFSFFSFLFFKSFRILDPGNPRKTCPENNTQEAQHVSCFGSAQGRGSGFLLRLQMGEF